MEDIITEIEESITTLIDDKRFIHHSWFKKYHLEIVRKISLELCEIYKHADKDLVELLVWLHDYEKITRDISGASDLEEFLKDKDIDESLAQTIIEYIVKIDSKTGLNDDSTPIEVKIISSSDAASHLTGPFFSIWFYDHPNDDIEELMKGNIGKLEKDWNKKVVLPEIHEHFRKYYEIQRDLNGIFPSSYLE